MSFPSFHEDAPARQQAGTDWKMMVEGREGERAIGGARMYSRLKDATAPAEAAAAGNFEAKRALGVSGYAVKNGLATTMASTPPPVAQSRIVQYAQQSQFAGGKTFFLNEKRWVDSEIQKHPQAKRVRIEFGSKEYFDLAAKHPEANEWLALGNALEFVIGETVYEVQG